ncbi:hypothetical protein JCM15519_31250 [Fundidesulfovibrio butyratiphilus]
METPQDLLGRARELSRSARRVIDRLGLETLWARAGRPLLVGSARFGLMTKPNIDFEIYAPSPDPRAGFAVAGELAALPGVEKMEYLNVMGTSDPGYYWRVFYRDDRDLLWDIDCWLVPDDHPYAGLADSLARELEAVLTGELRERILRVKSGLGAGQPVRGVDVYKAVLAGGAESAEAAARYLSDNPAPDMETWLPGGPWRHERA